MNLKNLGQIFQGEQTIMYYSSFDVITKSIGRRGGLMNNVPDSRSKSLCLSPGRGHCVVFLGNFTLKVALSNQE